MTYLVTFRRDWADEFDVTGFRICTQQQVDELKNWFSKPRTIYFGTNEGWEEEHFLDGFAFTEISDTQLATLTELFPLYGDVPWLGFVPYIDRDAED